MAIPDKLVTAASEAMHAEGCVAPCSHHRMEAMARVALVAAFAALPECDEVIITLGGDMPHTRATVRHVLQDLARMGESE